ncbi:MAG: hypothetical protein CMJ48_07400 [Planctomycetaceae bacterium]|nr:hypothetical protein [Planctomycetaceae bacterium]
MVQQAARQAVSAGCFDGELCGRMGRGASFPSGSHEMSSEIMAIKLTVESFVNVVRQSGLIEQDLLKRTLQEFREQGVATDDSREIADELVRREALTGWQAEKLLQGKHRGFFLGKYRLLRLLGKGGMSSVYLAEHVLMRRRCAIKVLPSKRVTDSSYLARFHREAQAVASLDHPNIVRAYDVDQEVEKGTEIHFLVMEYVDGRNLHEMVLADGPLPYLDAAEYIRQSALGLAHAHAAGLVHRDVKPGNLLVDRARVVKILDLGLARFFDENEENPLTVAHDEKVLGTADYLAPEQALDSHKVDTRADIYSLGCTLYFMLTGHPPFTEGTLAQRLMWHQTKEPAPVTADREDVPESLLAILNRMMAKQRDDRPQTADELAEEIGEWLLENADEEWKDAHFGILAGGSGSGIRARKTDSKRRRPVEAEPSIDEIPMAEVVLPLSFDQVDEASDADTVDAMPVVKDVEAALRESASAEKAPVVAEPVSERPSTKRKKGKRLESAKTASPVSKDASDEEQDDNLTSFLSGLDAQETDLGGAGPVTPTEVAPEAGPKSGKVRSGIQRVKAEAAKKVVEAAEKVVAAAGKVAGSKSKTVKGRAEGERAADDAKPAKPSSRPSTGNRAATAKQGSDAAAGTVPGQPPQKRVRKEGRGEQPSSKKSVARKAKVVRPVAKKTEGEDPVAPRAAAPVVGEIVSPVAVPEAGPVIDLPFVVEDVAAPEAPAAATAPSTSRRPSKRTVLTVASVVLVGGLAWMAYAMFAGDGDQTSEEGPVAKAKASESTLEKGRQVAAGMRELSVGPEGDFKTIREALVYLRKNRGAYDDFKRSFRIQVKVQGGVVYPERIVVDDSEAEYPKGIQIVAEGSEKAVLAPTATGPVVSLKGIERFTLEGFEVDASDRPVAIELSSWLVRTQLKQLTIRGFKETGIVGLGARGLNREELLLEGIRFEPASAEAVGIRLAEGGDSNSTAIDVRSCRFIGPMARGILVADTVNYLTVRGCIFFKTEAGIRFDSEEKTWSNTLIGNNTFYQSKSGIVFATMPADGSDELAFHRNLFSQSSGPEAIVETGFDELRFNEMLTTAVGAKEHNWTDRKQPDEPAENEVKLLPDSGLGEYAGFEFRSTDPDSADFLKPGAKNLPKNVGRPYAQLKPHVGAVKF